MQMLKCLKCLDLMRTVIERLMADSTEANDRETKIVVSSYNNRIRSIRSIADIEEPAVAKLRIELITIRLNSLFVLLNGMRSRHLRHLSICIGFPSKKT